MDIPAVILEASLADRIPAVFPAALWVGYGGLVSYGPDYYAQVAMPGGIIRNPQGPETPFDPIEPTEKKRVHRGGSFLCTDEYCSRYMVGTRGKGEITTGTNHLGFRCVKAPIGN